MITGRQDNTGPAMNIFGAIVPKRIRLNLRLRDKAALLAVGRSADGAATSLYRGRGAVRVERRCLRGAVPRINPVGAPAHGMRHRDILTAGSG